MSRPSTPNINRHVTYYNSVCKPLPSTVVAVIDTNTVTMRITHTGQTISNVARQIVGKAPNTWKVA